MTRCGPSRRVSCPFVLLIKVMLASRRERVQHLPSQSYHHHVIGQSSKDARQTATPLSQEAEAWVAGGRSESTSKRHMTPFRFRMNHARTSWDIQGQITSTVVISHPVFWPDEGDSKGSANQDKGL